jgi:hypothetical protein
MVGAFEDRDTPWRDLPIRRYRRRTPIEESGSMGVHVFGLTIEMLADAAQAAQTADRSVLLIDDVAEVVVVIDQHGRLLVRPESRNAA